MVLMFDIFKIQKNCILQSFDNENQSDNYDFQTILWLKPFIAHEKY